MKIEIWSDYVCPFCYIGKKQLEKAIEATGFEGQIDVFMKSYQLDPNAPIDSNISITEKLARNYRKTKDEVLEMTKGVKARAKEVGLNYDALDDLFVENTFKAHRLTKWAETKGKAIELAENLLRSHLVEGQRIGKDEVLLNIVEQSGLDRLEAAEVLVSDLYKDEVEADGLEGAKIGIRGVPFFVLNGKYGISGAQPQEVFEDTLRKVAEEEGLQPALKMVNSNSTGICTDDNCTF